MLFGRINPAVRAAIGVVLLVIGLVLHRLLFEVAGGAVLVLGGIQWLYASRRGGRGGPGGEGWRGGRGSRW
jgi:hypothetical protein